MAKDLLPQFILDNYVVAEHRHACAILKKDFRAEWDDIIRVLTNFQLLKSHICRPGGSKSKIPAVIEDALNMGKAPADLWREEQIKTKFTVTQGSTNVEETYDAQTHKIDCYKNKIGIEVEWNSKDQTFDRDLINFSHLFDLQRISVGVIITRSLELQDLFKKIDEKLKKAYGATYNKKLSSKYGASTTHMGKLLGRIAAGRGGGCPILAFGIKPSLYFEDISDAEAKRLILEEPPTGDESEDL